MRLRVPILSVLVAATLLAASTEAQEAKPRVPPGRDPGGVAIALIGTGIDYTIPEVAQRLARDGEGELIGWDLEHKDRKPFDKSKGSTRPEWGGDGTLIASLFGCTADHAAGPGPPRSRRSRIGRARDRVRGADARPDCSTAHVEHDARGLGAAAPSGHALQGRACRRAGRAGRRARLSGGAGSRQCPGSRAGDRERRYGGLRWQHLARARARLRPWPRPRRPQQTCWRGSPAWMR